MTTTIENILEAMKKAEKIRPKVGGFPYLAECLRQANVTRNVWHLPSAQSTFFTKNTAVTFQNEPLVKGPVEIPAYDEAKFLKALRADQAGETSFPEFLKATWEAGIVSYEVDFLKRTCTYYGINDENYTENYPSVSVK
ncbi:DUF1398 domain-containing protein [Lactococcus nasutitermitis]|uniref:DUF1398 domain-containing protein n=1 Tax=Lactococcus nasutitermitis TaxID=1652957 RepID=A0ABV9JIQ2_9LACT|nr:DUF1398 family protein [Lactococcus nasutitermitis]